jgi:hypothetical protein
MIYLYNNRLFINIYFTTFEKKDINLEQRVF